MTLPSHGQAIAAVARLTVRRLLRSRARYLSLIAATLPLLFAVISVAAGKRSQLWADVVNITIPLIAVIPPLHLASILAEEFERQSYTFLYSRPISRPAILFGKLIALAPITAAMLALSMAAAGLVVAQATDLSNLDIALASLAFFAGGTTIGISSAAIGSLVPRQSLAGSVVYVLVVDLPMGAMPFTLRNLSVTYHIREFSTDAPSAAHMLWIVCLGATWLALATWRTARSEPRAQPG